MTVPRYRWPLPILASLGILCLSSIPGTPSPDPDKLARLIQWIPPNVQNLFHIPAYAIIGLLWSRAFGGGAVRMITAGTLCGLVLGMIDESWQSLIPGRYASLGDLSFDVIGAALGAFLYLYVSRRRQSAASLP